MMPVWMPIPTAVRLFSPVQAMSGRSATPALLGQETTSVQQACWRRHVIVPTNGRMGETVYQLEDPPWKRSHGPQCRLVLDAGALLSVQRLINYLRLTSLRS